jgi:hypothetical protein
MQDHTVSGPKTSPGQEWLDVGPRPDPE